MRLENFIDGIPTLNENVIKNMLNRIKSKSADSVQRIFKDAWLKISLALKEKEGEVLNIINSKLGTHFKSFDEISKTKPIMESNELNESWGHYWELLKSEGFPTLAFYPALTAWIEIGKILEPEQSVNWTKFGAYALFWLLLVSGRFIKGYKDWKKQNPDEYYSERPKLAKKHNYKFKDSSMDPNIQKRKPGFI